MIVVTGTLLKSFRFDSLLIFFEYHNIKLSVLHIVGLVTTICVTIFFQVSHFILNLSTDSGYHKLTGYTISQRRQRSILGSLHCFVWQGRNARSNNHKDISGICCSCRSCAGWGRDDRHVISFNDDKFSRYDEQKRQRFQIIYCWEKVNVPKICDLHGIY